MSLHWYACISTNTCCFEMHHISLETDWWALPNASSIVWIRPAVCEILADKAFIATDVLISQSFVAAFVPPAYMQIALIWSFPVQLGLWKSVHWLWRYNLNEVCDRMNMAEFKIQRKTITFCNTSLIFSYNTNHLVNRWTQLCILSSIFSNLYFTQFREYVNKILGNLNSWCSA